MKAPDTGTLRHDALARGCILRCIAPAGNLSCAAIFSHRSSLPCLHCLLLTILLLYYSRPAVPSSFFLKCLKLTKLPEPQRGTKTYKAGAERKADLETFLKPKRRLENLSLEESTIFAAKTRAAFCLQNGLDCVTGSQGDAMRTVIPAVAAALAICMPEMAFAFSAAPSVVSFRTSSALPLRPAVRKSPLAMKASNRCREKL